MSTTAPRGWRICGIGAGLFATVVWVLSVSQPWFERYDPPFGSFTYTPWLWADKEHPSIGDYPGVTAQLADLVLRREWGVMFMVLTAVGAVLSFMVAAKRPTATNVRRATIASVVLAAICLVLSGLMWYAFAGDGMGAHSQTELRTGFLVGAPAILGWFVLAVVVVRMGRVHRHSSRDTHRRATAIDGRI